MPAKKTKKKPNRKDNDKRIDRILERRRKNMLAFACMYKVPSRDRSAVACKKGKS